jgi:hypothetical protein
MSKALLIHVLQPNTWIRCITESFFHDRRKNEKIMFLGWVSNPQGCHNAVCLDDRGVFTIDINEEGWEIV